MMGSLSKINNAMKRDNKNQLITLEDSGLFKKVKRDLFEQSLLNLQIYT